MTVLALKMSRRANAVSSLHGQVSRAMWAPLFPVEARTACRSDTSRTAFTFTPGSRRRCNSSTTATSVPTGRSDAAEPGFWEAIDQVDDGELWETHQALKVRAHRHRATAGRAVGRATRRAARVRRPAAAVAEPGCPDDRIRAAFRHLQARQSDPRATSKPSRRSRTTRRRRSSWSLPAKPIHRTRPGKEMLQEVARLMRDPRFAGKVAVHRGLRHQCRPAPGAGRRRAG